MHPSPPAPQHQHLLPPPRSPLLEPAQSASLPADRNPALTYLASLPSPNSRASMRSALRACAAIICPGAPFERIPWHRLRYQHTAAIRSALLASYAPSTVNLCLSALRRVLKEAWLLDLMGVRDYQAARQVALVRFTRLPPGRRVPSGELRALFEAAAKRPGAAGPRDAAVLALLFGGGLRRSEVVSLDIKDISLTERVASVRSAKGRKDRRVPLPAGTVAALEAWCRVRGDREGPLLWRCRRGGHLVPGRLTPASISRILEKLAKAAAVLPVRPHDLRRTFITELLSANADVLSVSRLAGHSSPKTTRRYDLRGEEADRNAVDRLHVPFGEG